MKLTGTNPDPAARVQLDTAIRGLIKTYLHTEAVSVDEVVFLLTRMLPELAEYPLVEGNIMAAYHLAGHAGKQPILKADALKTV